MTSDLATPTATMANKDEHVAMALGLGGGRMPINDDEEDTINEAESNENENNDNNIPQAIDSSSVSNAIREAAANSSTQTRFSFYNAQEVQLEITGSTDGKSTEPTDPNRFTFYNSGDASTIEGKEPSPTNVANSNFGLQQLDATSRSSVNNAGGSSASVDRPSRPGRGRGKLPNLTPLVTDATVNPEVKQQAEAIAEASSREQLVGVDNLPGLGVALSSGSADEILRSLQETEEQRMQLLKAMSPADDLSNANTKSSRRSAPSSQGSATNAAVPSSNRGQEFAASSLATTGPMTAVDAIAAAVNDVVDRESNPYEDAIKEALDLLRRHRSPPGSPELSGSVDLLERVAVTGEDPAPEAITLLSPKSRALRQRTPRENDRVLQSRWDDGEDIIADPGALEEIRGGNDASVSYEEAKLKAKQRQERMAQYASRLQEFKSSLPSEMNTSHISEPITPSTALQQLEQQHPLQTPSFGQSRSEDHDSDKLIGSPVRHIGATDESVGLSDISQSTRQRDDEIQRGVERVLLAILERANNSRGRASQESSVSHQPLPPVEPVEQMETHMSEDSLLRAMEELLGSVASENASEVSIAKVAPTPEEILGTTGSPSLENDGRHSLEQTTVDQCSISTGVSSKRMTEKSVVDELLAEVEEDDPEFKVLQSPSSTAALPEYCGNWHPHREEKKLPDSTETFQRNNPAIKETPSVSSTSHGNGRIGSKTDRNDDGLVADDGYGIHEDDGETEENDEGYVEVGDDASQNDNGEALDRVLGPLSQKAGGTTGVVLDLQSQSSPGNEEDEERSSILDSFSNVMKEAETVISYVASAISPQRSDDKLEDRPVEDKYSVEEYERDDGDVDEEAVELMRTLCAHLLPFGVDQSNQLLEAIPAWDERNPNEAGYRIIRLSRNQLRRVERAFEAMINGLKRDSERHLNKLEAATAEGYDATFEKELQEAEKLLDDEEKRVKNAEAQKQKLFQLTKKKSTDIKQLQPGALSLNDDDNQGPAEDETLQCHPDFPGVKSAGKGEMGDFEYFHLPIIFKSHVTGFEPTKDLVLEPGNVVAGQYMVESELGSAAFSTAYRCIDLSSDNGDGDAHDEVCLKVIKNTKDFFDQSLDEIKILELLRQTGKCEENHIVEMKTFFYHREHLIIVTELLRQNLFEFGKFITDNDEEPYFTKTRLAYITRQMLKSLQFVHSLGLVHSDVKPENILLGSYSRAQVKLIDFGSSCYLTDRQSSYIQSRSYRAPEVVLGLPYDGKIDIWSLGCVVAEMYTGEVTFQNDSIVSMLSRIESICGPFPRHMIAQGRQSGRFFTKSGLLFETVDDSDSGNKRSSYEGSSPTDDDSDNDSSGKSAQFDIFQPKTTRLSSRLGFSAELMDEYGDISNNSIFRNKDRRDEAMFTDFVQRLLTIDPDGRPNATEALEHPWMQFAATLTEEDIKYPSS